MDSEHKLVAAICGLIAGLILVLTLGAYCISWKKDVDMAKLGFQRVTIQGSTATYYHKICDCEGD